MAFQIPNLIRVLYVTSYSILCRHVNSLQSIKYRVGQKQVHSIASNYQCICIPTFGPLCTYNIVGTQHVILSSIIQLVNYMFWPLYLAIIRFVHSLQRKAITCLYSCKSYLRQRITTYKPEEDAQILSDTTKLFCVLPQFGNLDSKIRQQDILSSVWRSATAPAAESLQSIHMQVYTGDQYSVNQALILPP